MVSHGNAANGGWQMQRDGIRPLAQITKKETTIKYWDYLIKVLCQSTRAIRPMDSPNIGLHICVVVLQCRVNRQVNRILAFLRVVLMNEH